MFFKTSNPTQIFSVKNKDKNNNNKPYVLEILEKNQCIIWNLKIRHLVDFSDINTDFFILKIRYAFLK